MLSIGNKMPVGIVKRPMFQAKTNPAVQPQFSALLDVFRFQKTIDAREAKKKDIATILKYVECLEKVPMKLDDDRGCVNLGGRKFLVTANQQPGRGYYEAETIDNGPRMFFKSNYSNSQITVESDLYLTIYDEERSVNIDQYFYGATCGGAFPKLDNFLRKMSKRANRG